MDNRDWQRQRLRDLMQIAQIRYPLPGLGEKYQAMYERANKLLNVRRITDANHTETFKVIMADMAALEAEAKPLIEQAREAEYRAFVEQHESKEEPPKRGRGGRRPGAGRKKSGMTSRNLTLSLPPGYWETIDRLQELRGGDLTSLIRSLVVSMVDYSERGGQFDEVVCPVCDGAGKISPKGKEMICPSCDGEGKLQQIRI